MSKLHDIAAEERMEMSKHNIVAEVCGTEERYDVDVKCVKPHWKHLYECYSKQTRKIGLATVAPEIRAAANVECVTRALLETGMQLCFNSTVSDKNIREQGFFKDAGTLEDWLLNKDVWRRATVAGKMSDSDVIEEMNLWNGVLIVKKGSDDSKYVFLWENRKLVNSEILAECSKNWESVDGGMTFKCDVVDGEVVITSDDTVCFWGLERCAAVYPQKYKTTTDAGHGDGDSPEKMDHGVTCEISECDGKNEDYFALMVEEQVHNWLSAFGIENQRTRIGEYVRSEKEERVRWRYEKANKNESKILVSIHLDSTNRDESIIFWNKKNKDNNIELAECIVKNMNEIKPHSEPIKEDVKSNGKSFGVLREFGGKAAVLIEVCGIGSKNSIQLIKTNASGIGKDIATGVYEYLYNKKPICTE